MLGKVAWACRRSHLQGKNIKHACRRQRKHERKGTRGFCAGLPSPVVSAVSWPATSRDCSQAMHKVKHWFAAGLNLPIYTEGHKATLLKHQPPNPRTKLSREAEPSALKLDALHPPEQITANLFQGSKPKSLQASGISGKVQAPRLAAGSLATIGPEAADLEGRAVKG